MGFDMYIARPKPEHPNKGYFRFNIFGMGRALDVMDHAGMLTDTSSPDWPKPEDHGLTDEVFEWADDDLITGAPPAARDFLALYKATRDITPDDPTGISIHKFGSNDGWLVTEAELTAALATWDALSVHQQFELVASDYGTRAVDSDYWAQWIAFLRNASTSGGFRVF